MRLCACFSSSIAEITECASYNAEFDKNINPTCRIVNISGPRPIKDVFEKRAGSTTTLADESGFVAVETADQPRSAATSGPGSRAERVSEQADDPAVPELPSDNTRDVHQLRHRITEATLNFLHELSKIHNDHPNLLPQLFHPANCFDAIDNIFGNLMSGHPPFDNGSRNFFGGGRGHHHDGRHGHGHGHRPAARPHPGSEEPPSGSWQPFFGSRREFPASFSGQHYPFAPYTGTGHHDTSGHGYHHFQHHGHDHRGHDRRGGHHSYH
jgi:hypothetical protein